MADKNDMEDGLVQSDYYQAGATMEVVPTASSWHFTDFGHVGERSRDGSVHATDEVFNSASHLGATLLSTLGSALLITQASSMGEPWKIVAFCIYGASLVFLFGASTLHHSLVGPKIEPFLKMMDYLAIFPLISGTFTPLCLVFFHDNTIGWTFFGVIWILAICGMVLTACLHERIPKWLSMTLYITMGWLGGCMTYWLAPYLGAGGLALLVLGGVFFTVGGYIFYTEQPNPIPGKFGFHEIWHVAVILGALTHWTMMYFFVLPYERGAGES
mmetsp:Transcript_25295/g.69855  ORF Transcript_25295/g.69855 Transcript_25295/m.69855 type:complete len:272 (-) Transcript_25295:1456-2271(-)